MTFTDSQTDRQTDRNFNNSHLLAGAAGFLFLYTLEIPRQRSRAHRIAADAIQAQPLVEDALRLAVQPQVVAVEPAHLPLLRLREVLEGELGDCVRALAVRVRAWLGVGVAVAVALGLRLRVAVGVAVAVAVAVGQGWG